MSAQRLFRLLLLLYPPRFRRQFGREMRAFVDARARRGSSSEAWAFVMRDAARALPAAWLDALRSVLRRLRGNATPTLIHPDLAPTSMRRGALDMFGTFFRDLHFALRNLTRTPGFTAVAVATLTLGVGANTAIFSVVNGVMLRPLPYHEPDNLYMVGRFESGGESMGFSQSQPDIEDIATQVTALESAAGYNPANFTITRGDQPELVRGGRVTTGLLEVFHLSPTMGRDLRPEENVPGGPLVAVIGHAFWQERFGGDPDVLGQTVELSERTFEIVGVAPAGFDYPDGAQVWVPRYHNLDGCARGCRSIRLVTRLQAGSTRETAQGQLDALAARLQGDFPESNFGTEFRFVALADTVYGDVRTGLFVLLGAVGLVLLIACANVANLLLVRGTARAGEFAVRAALGASRGRLITQLLIEALVLAGAGGALGVALARASLASLLRLAPSDLPRLDEVAVDATVLIFALGTVTVITLLFGLMPAFRLARTPVAETLNQGRGAGGSVRAWVRSALLVGEVALSLALLFGAGLLLRSFSELNAVELGFDKERTLAFTISLPGARYGNDESVRFFEDLESRIAGIPGVESVGGAFGSPMGSSNVGGSFTLLDRPEPPPGQEPSAWLRPSTVGYLETLRIPIVRGRGFTHSDRRDTQRVVLVSQAFADRYFPEQNPVGVQIDLDVSVGYANDENYTIVGVVADIRSRSVRTEPAPEIYTVQSQAGSSYMRMMVRMSPGATDVLPGVRRAVRAIDPNIVLRSISTLEAEVDRALGPTRFYLVLLFMFAGVAVVLAAIGLYGVAGYLVSRRTREIGIRMALGAEGGDVVRLILSQSMRPAMLGIVVGAVGTLAGARVLRSMVYNVGIQDPVTFAAVTLVLLAVVIVAVLIPARQASRIPPVVAFRAEA